MRSPGAFPLFLTMSLLVFLLSGVGNGSTFRMIPAAFKAEHARRAAGGGTAARAAADRAARKAAAAVLGFSSAIAAYGSFVIPQAYNLSISATGGVAAALAGFIAFYVTCIGVTWYCFMRRPARAAVPALAEAV
jgi:NNP family nitrate/nitrite transporter-like MFS transporter